MRITRSLEIPDDEFEMRFSRSSGPGGQNVNRRSTKVEVVFDVAGSPSLGPYQRRRLLEALDTRLDANGCVRVVSQDGRTQTENRERALRKLRELLAAGLAPPPAPRRPTAPTRASRERRLRDKRVRAQRKSNRAVPED